MSPHLLAILWLSAFADNWLYDLDQPAIPKPPPPPPPPPQNSYLFFCLLLVSLLVTQSALIRIEEFAFHKKRRMTGLLLFSQLCV